jgi:membrane associated rhomboid family serine protease
VKSKGSIGVYFVVGILGIAAGVANLAQKHYVFGAIYGLFGCIWLLMAMLKSRLGTSPGPGAVDAAEPGRKPSQP